MLAIDSASHSTFSNVTQTTLCNSNTRMSQPFWIHCNSCFTLFTSSLKFAISNCGHVLCEKCACKDPNKRSCPICQTKTNLTSLNKDTSPDLLSYFQPPTQNLGKMLKVMQFQYKNQYTLFKEMSRKYNCAKQEIYKCYKVMNDMKKENSRLKHLLSQGRGSFVASTPMSHHSNASPGFNNMSMVSSVTNGSGGYSRRNMQGTGFIPSFSDAGNRSNYPSLSHVVPNQNTSSINSIGSNQSAMRNLSLGQHSKQFRRM